jgi:hypothetical protein
MLHYLQFVGILFELLPYQSIVVTIIWICLNQDVCCNVVRKIDLSRYPMGTVRGCNRQHHVQFLLWFEFDDSLHVLFVFEAKCILKGVYFFIDEFVVFIEALSF